MPKLNQQGIAHILLILVLLGVGLAAGLYLVQNPVDFFPQASGEPIVLKDMKNNNLPKNDQGIAYTISNQIRVKLTSTIKPPKIKPPKVSSPVTPKPSPVSGPVQDNGGEYKRYYKIAEDPATLTNLPNIPYLEDSVTIDFTFKDSNIGIKNIWVEFSDSSGKTDRRTAQVELRAKPAPTPTPRSGCNTLGDANLDGGVGSVDALCVQRYVSNLPATTACPKNTASIKRMDVNNDGKVTTEDSDLILQKVVGNVAAFPGCPTPKPTATPKVTPTPVPTPTPTPSKRVFVTSTNYNGNLGGLSGADQKCQDRANAANLGGTWKAWLSDSSISAASRLSHSDRAYKLITGILVALNWTDLTDGTIQNPITVTENGNTLYPAVWTASRADGTSYALPTNKYSQSCSDWVSIDSRDQARIGAAGTYKDVRWTDYATIQCTSKLSLYCLEQ